MFPFRTYGKEPYRIVVIHGGPGAPGGMAYVAGKLSDKFGVIEPFQTSDTIRGQVEELHSILKDNCVRPPVKLVGHSWGAWLAFIFAAEFPDFVDRLILISAGAFEEKYNAGLMKIRLGRLKRNEADEAQNLMRLIA